MPSCWVAFVCKTSLLNTFSLTHIVAAYTTYRFTRLLHSFLCVLGWLINTKIWNKVKWILILVSMFPFLLQDQLTRWYQSWQLHTQYSDGPDKKVTFGHKIPSDMPLGSICFLGCYRCAETHAPDLPFKKKKGKKKEIQGHRVREHWLPRRVWLPFLTALGVCASLPCCLYLCDPQLLSFCCPSAHPSFYLLCKCVTHCQGQQTPSGPDTVRSNSALSVYTLKWPHRVMSVHHISWWSQTWKDFSLSLKSII